MGEEETDFVCIQQKVTPTRLNQKGRLLQSDKARFMESMRAAKIGEEWNPELESCPEPAVTLFVSVPS